MRQRRRAYLGAQQRDLILSHPSGKKKAVIRVRNKVKNRNIKPLKSEFVPKDSFTDTNDIDLWLKVNDKFRQQGNTKDMIFK